MNIALVALAPDQTPLLPPLVLAYIAALLEQQRHIVRIYDLGLPSVVNSGQSSRLLRSFRPQVVVVMGEDEAQLGPALAELHNGQACVLTLVLRRDHVRLVDVCRDILMRIEEQERNSEKTSLTPTTTLQSIPAHIDGLPSPARHLLALECYGLRACGGELQTTLLIGERDASGVIQLRRPDQVVNEMRAVSREHGVRHYLLCGAALTSDKAWLQTFANCLIQANLELAWEGVVKPEQVSEELLDLLYEAGCEGLLFDFDVSQVLEIAASRNTLKDVVAATRRRGIHARAELSLAPPYESIPQLVDVAATFGLDDVIFRAPAADQEQTNDIVNVTEMARQRYSAERNRQHFIERFGARFGSLIWNVRQSYVVAQLWNAIDGIEHIEREDPTPIA